MRPGSGGWKRFGSLIFVLTMVSSRFPAAAQVPAGHDLRFSGVESFDAEHVSDIVADGRGFLWLATANGLTRFDGRHMVGIEDLSAGQLTERRTLYDLLLDSRQRLWVVGEEAAYIVDTVSGDVQIIGGLEGRTNLTVAEFDEDTLYIGTLEDGLKRVDANGRILEAFAADGGPGRLAASRVQRILVAPDGYLWIAQYDEVGLHRFDPKSGLVDRPIRPLGPIRNLGLDGRGNLFALVPDGIAVINLETLEERVLQTPTAYDGPSPRFGTKRSLPYTVAEHNGVFYVGGLNIDLGYVDLDWQEYRALPLASDGFLRVGSRQVDVLAPGPGGRLWVGGFVGLSVLESEEKPAVALRGADDRATILPLRAGGYLSWREGRLDWVDGSGTHLAATATGEPLAATPGADGFWVLARDAVEPDSSSPQLLFRKSGSESFETVAFDLSAKLNLQPWIEVYDMVESEPGVIMLASSYGVLNLSTDVGTITEGQGPPEQARAARSVVRSSGEVWSAHDEGVDRLGVGLSVVEAYALPSQFAHPESWRRARVGLWPSPFPDSVLVAYGNRLLRLDEAGTFSVLLEQPLGEFDDSGPPPFVLVRSSTEIWAVFGSYAHRISFPEADRKEIESFPLPGFFHAGFLDDQGVELVGPSGVFRCTAGTGIDSTGRDSMLMAASVVGDVDEELERRFRRGVTATSSVEERTVTLRPGFEGPLRFRFVLVGQGSDGRFESREIRDSGATAWRPLRLGDLEADVLGPGAQRLQVRAASGAVNEWSSPITLTVARPATASERLSEHLREVLLAALASAMALVLVVGGVRRRKAGALKAFDERAATSVLDALDVMTFRLDEEHRIVAVNKPALRRLEPGRRVQGVPIGDLVELENEAEPIPLRTGELPEGSVASFGGGLWRPVRGSFRRFDDWASGPVFVLTLQLRDSLAEESDRLLAAGTVHDLQRALYGLRLDHEELATRPPWQQAKSRLDSSKVWLKQIQAAIVDLGGVTSDREMTTLSLKKALEVTLGDLEMALPPPRSGCEARDPGGNA